MHVPHIKFCHKNQQRVFLLSNLFSQIQQIHASDLMIDPEEQEPVNSHFFCAHQTSWHGLCDVSDHYNWTNSSVLFPRCDWNIRECYNTVYCLRNNTCFFQLQLFKQMQVSSFKGNSKYKCFLRCPTCKKPRSSYRYPDIQTWGSSPDKTSWLLQCLHILIARYSLYCTASYPQQKYIITPSSIHSTAFKCRQQLCQQSPTN